MKSFLLNFLRKNIYLMLAAFLLFVAAFCIDRYLGGTFTTGVLKNSIESFLQSREKDFEKLLVKPGLIDRLATQQYTRTELDDLLDKKYGIRIYDQTDRNPSLLFWSDQTSVIPDSLLKRAEGNFFVHLSNGQFEYIKRNLPRNGSSQPMVVALIPIRWQYYISPENLKPEFAGSPTAENRLRIASHVTDFPVKNHFGQTLFYLEKMESYHAAKYSMVLLMTVMIGVLILLVIIHNMAHAISEKLGPVIGIVFLVIMILVFRMVVYAYPDLLHLRQYELFDPTIYSSSYVLRSLGDLLINALLFCWIVLFVRQEIGEYTMPSYRMVWKRWLTMIVTLLVMVATTFLFGEIVQSLVADARISFNVTNFFSLSIYSVIGFLILAALAFSYFFFTQILLRLIRPFIEGNILKAYIVIAIGGLTYLTFNQNTSRVELDIYVLLWLIAYVWLMMRNLFSGLHYQLNVSEILFWLFVFSISISVIIVFENRKIELEQRKSFADRLAEQVDPTSEKLVSMSLMYFDNDFLSRDFERFRDPVANRFIKDSLVNNNFIAYINKYDTRIFSFDSTEKPLYNQLPVSFDTLNTIFQVQGKPTEIQDLKYYEKSYDKFSYIYKKVIRDAAKKTKGYLFILAEPRSYKSDGLAPELTTQRKEYLPEYSPVYSYAIYSNNELVTYYNNYPFPTQLSDSMVPRYDFTQKKSGSYDELWHNIADNKVIVIAKKDNSLIEAITLFSYLFSAFLVLVALFWLSSLLIQTRLHWQRLKEYLQLNIRSQIHTTIIFVSLFLFLVIGVSTILFLINRYNRNSQDRLSSSIKVMVNELRDKLPTYGIPDGGAINPVMVVPRGELEKIVDNIAETHGADLNLYDMKGTLIVSSNPFVYTKGILSQQMHPLAYYYMNRLKSVEYFNKEQMGRISFQSIYCPLRVENASTCAYLNIPSFNTEVELNDEISRFLVTIINLNVFIFLIAGTIALFLTNRITSSFALISEKMQQVNLSKTNETIDWHKNDEIGGLIREYNKMVGKLVESAAALAKSEREGAWREMARQVAHEIKNPLTPMKLSIQYLQKAINNNNGNIKELTANVANTLVEQIDHLSRIAADFSQFANIGNPRNEIFDLHDMLYSLTSLYETTENLLFKWVPVPQRIMVYADKTQLNRLFTNLLQNALEACHGRDKCVVSVSEEMMGDAILVKVTDNGEGIPDQMREKIFIPNFTTKSSGTGLGLAMSKTIVEQARGKIWFDTRVNEGTTFYVELPVLGQ